ncbi:MAG: 2-isopropylmalate synthase [Actinomycetota bacterium]|nr:2-isopropylmalate synthase [Actinomycetota bacterium]
MESDMEEKKGKIYIFDTTLRDGEQAPGIHLNTREKLEIAKQLEKLNVDVIEAGFPISSKSDFNSVREISKEIRNRKIAALARANFKDIDAAGEALKEAEQPVIHTFISSSDIHLKYQLKKSREEVLELAGEAVKRSRNYTDVVEFSAMDATRSDWAYLCRLYEIAIKNGATIINVPDTVGYALPDEFGEMIDYIFENTEGIENVVVSVHCHNDLGLAVANSLAAIKHGARQVECAVNGIGERAGNAALEEIVMIIDTRKNRLGMYTDINTKEIIRTSSIVRSLTGYIVAPNKAIVGKNAFSHEAGIHQDGMLKDRSTYEIIRPEDIGLKSSKLVLGKHSGRHAFVGKLNELGIHLSEENLEKAFERFKDLAEKKGAINDEDIKAIAEDEIREVTEHFLLKYYRIQSGSDINAEATVGIEINGKLHESSSTGNGPVDASFKAIDKIVNINTRLIEYNIEAVSGGKDALGSVKVVVSTNGVEVMGSGISTDIVEASIKAYVDAMNRIVENKE